MFYMNNINMPVDSPALNHKPGSGGEATIVMTIITQYMQRIQSIREATKAIRSSPGVREILEYILVFGNYLNCSTRTLATAPAYGFKLQTLDLITETKSSVDRSRSLLHYLVDVIMTKEKPGGNHSGPSKSEILATALAIRPLLISNRSQHQLTGSNSDASVLENIKMPFDFDRLLQTIERATSVSLETCVAEVAEIEKGMELCRNELQLRNQGGLATSPATKTIQQFIQQKGPEVSGLKEELRKTQQQYNECVEYFGENPKMLESSNQLFGTFVRFLKNFKQCQLDNLMAQRKSIEEELRQQILAKQQQRMMQQQQQQQQNGNGSQSDHQMQQGQTTSDNQKVKEKRLLKQDEVYNGALEDILSGLKNEPFRRADAVRRSQRRRLANMATNEMQDNV
ncbi:hypothetical protein BLA29_006212 [Euroglyphus maynei]|uniref:FH2 domain-containing protein n=1 Tax=Euroglyphus maynei TaxID=6958 RepID=A0A1Y3B0J6_EURMA|nr:hypothetical protein BLA29_006212 [Euroglyphus maynei]